MDAVDSETWISDSYYGSLNRKLSKIEMAKSRPEIRLTEFVQQLELAETRCGSLKSKLDYMKMLYQGVQVGSDKVQEAMETQLSQNASFERFTPSTSHTDISYSNENLFGKLKLHEFNEKVEEIQRIAKENIESARYTPKMDSKLISFSPRSDASYTSKKIKALNFEEEQKAQIINVADNKIKSCADPVDKTNEIIENSYQIALQQDIKQSPRLQQDVLHGKEDISSYIVEDQYDYLYHSNSARKDSNKREVILSIPRTIENRQSSKCKNLVKEDNLSHKNKTLSSPLQKKNLSASKLNEATTPKIRKKKGKLSNANSRSTVTTKDTSLIGRKYNKKHKQRGRSNSRHATTQKTQQNWKEVVEIYHNTAAKNETISAVSSKHSKLLQARRLIKPPAVINDQQETRRKSINKSDRSQHYQRDKENVQNPHRESFQDQKRIETVKEDVEEQHLDFEGPKNIDVPQPEKSKSYQSQHVLGTSYYDPMTVHNYEMPTLASKLKRANRSYFSRFNFRNIPFVVGTSLSPSHNLGLNIQQVLSIMKTRQPTIGGVTPMLIRKVSRGIKPVTVLMGQINDPYKKPSQNLNFQLTDIPEEKRDLYCSQNSIENETACLRYINSMSANHVPRDIPLANQWSSYQPTGCMHMMKKNISNTKMLKQFTSQRNMNNQPNTSDVMPKPKEGINVNVAKFNSDVCSHNSKSIREVLIKLHDQFEEMNTKYEKLQTEIEKSDNKTLAKEMSSLEKELNAKEEEINAVVSLYKEVTALKQQMKMLQNRNSFVCIATNVMPHYSHNPEHAFDRRRISTAGGMKEPSTSIRLAGLLRQIQMFQKQLAS